MANGLTAIRSIGRATLPRIAHAGGRRRDRNPRRGRQQRFQQSGPEVREAQICLCARTDSHDRGLGAETSARVPGLVGHHAAPQLATYDIMENLWPIVHEKFSPEEIWGWCRDALIECARYAEIGRYARVAKSPAGHQRLPRRPAHGRRGELARI